MGKFWIGLVWFYDILTIVSYFMAKTVLFQTIQFRTSIVFLYSQFNVKTVLFQTIHFSMSM